MVTFFQERDTFMIGELIKALKMNSRTVRDWLDLYQAFNSGPPIREITVNDRVVYEVLHEKKKGPQEVESIEMAPTKGVRRTKLQKALAFVAFLTQQDQAFFRTTMEEALGMKPNQSKNWLALYQIFNQGPALEVEQEKKILHVRRE